MAESAKNFVKLLNSLGKLPGPAASPRLIMVGGLPGTGKSLLANGLKARVPGAVLLTSDVLRKILFPKPDYSQEESTRLFLAIHQLTEDLLKKGVTVILDATSLTEQNRKPLYDIAEKINAKLIIVWVTAPPAIVRQHMNARFAGATGNSDADWEVYEKLKPSVEKISRKHFVVDTSKDTGPALNRILKAILTPGNS
jgi:predicted kinase